MARPPNPWYWKARKEWYVTIRGERHRLGPDKEEAVRRFHELMAKQPEDRVIAPGTVAEIIEHFMDWTEANRPRSYDWYRKRIDRFYSLIAHVRVEQLKPYHIQRELDKRKWSDTYKAGCVTALRRVFNWAVEQGYTDKNPLRGLKKPAAQPRDRILSLKEFEEALSCVPNAQFKDLTRFVWYTGCRPQEAIRIEARHLEEAKRRLVLPPPEAKGKKKPRIIYLVDEALEIVKRNAQAHPEGPIFRNTQGRPWTPYAVCCTFGRIKEKMGERFCMYTLRHSYATHALQGGVDPVTLANLLGHADTAMLARVYANVAQDTEFMQQSARRARNDGS